MKNIATIVPVKHLVETYNDNYFMALSYLVNNPAYQHFMSKQSQLGKYVILDNSAIEAGEPESFETYLEKAFCIGASEIMLPDYFRNSGKTIQEAIECLRKLNSYTPVDGVKYNVMIIPQGNTAIEWLECANIMINLNGVTTVGVSCRYTEMFGGNRINIFGKLIPLLKHGQYIHLLGCYGNPRMEVGRALLFPEVRSVDSSYPCVYTKHEYYLSEEMFYMPRPERAIDFVNDEYDVNLLRYNIRAWKSACLLEKLPLR